MDNNKVYFGLSNVHIAFFSDTSTDTAPAWDAPIPIPGAVDFSPDSQDNEYKFNADNGVYYATYSDNGYTGDLEMAKFPDAVLVKAFGWVVDDLGGLLEVNNGVHRNFALLAQIEGDKHGRRVVYYNCAGSRPKQSMHTTEDNVEVKTQTMNITVAPVQLPNGPKVTKYALAADSTVPDSKTAYDNFFATVYVPSLSEG